MKEGIGQHTPEREALHASEEDEADLQGSLDGFAQPEVDEEHATDEYAAYSPHGALSYGDGNGVQCRNAASHVVAIHVGGTDDAGCLGNGCGGGSGGSGERHGEILGEDFALRVTRMTAAGHVFHSALSLDGDVQGGAHKRGFVDGVGDIDYRLDAGIHAEWLTELFGQLGGIALSGCRDGDRCYVNHNFDVLFV